MASDVMLRGCMHPEDAKRAFVAARDCADDAEGSYVVTVRDTLGEVDWLYRVRKLATRVVVYCPGRLEPIP